jgi:uncharacterized membrane protein YqjE
MEERKQEKEEKVSTIVIMLIVTAVFDYLGYCGLLKLITLCFNLAFTWKWATGVFLIIIVLKSIFKQSND